MLKVHDCEFIISAVAKEFYPKNETSEVTILGRSNVGKSTFINKFCNRKKLAYTSSKPGKTQTLNFFKINEELHFVDVPGYGYAKVSKKQRELFGQMIEEYLVNRINLKFVVLLVDFKVGPTEDDIIMYNFLKYHQKEVFIIATKKDKIKNSLHNKQIKMIKEKMNIDVKDTFFPYSATCDKDMEAIHKCFLEKLR